MRLPRSLVAPLVLVLVGASVALAKPEEVQLRKGDLPGLVQTYQASLGPFWPQVVHLPEALKTPENAPQSAALLSQVVLGNFKLEGLRSVWGVGAEQVTIDTGQYSSPTKAREALAYMVYEGAAPVYHALYFPYPGSGQSGPVGAMPEWPAVQRVDVGDHGYEVAWARARLLYFCKGPFVFLVDALDPQREKAAALALCQQVEAWSKIHGIDVHR